MESRLSDACKRPLGDKPRGFVPFAPQADQLTTSTTACSKGNNNRTEYPTAANAWTAIALVISSSEQLSRFVVAGNYDNWVGSLLGRSTNIVPIIFYPSAEPFFKVSPKSLNGSSWQSVAFNARRCPPPNANVPGTQCAKWVNDRAQIFLTCSVNMAVPDLYHGDLMRARTFHLRTFCGPPAFSGEYIVANKWYTYPMFLEPVLAYFDFWAKFDVDVCFKRPFEFADVFGPMIARRAPRPHRALYACSPDC